MNKVFKSTLKLLRHLISEKIEADLKVWVLEDFYFEINFCYLFVKEFCSYLAKTLAFSTVLYPFFIPIHPCGFWSA